MKQGMFAAAVLAVFGAGAAHAQSIGNPASDTALVRVNILKPITVDAVENLRFGSIVPGASNGSVIIDADTGARTLSGVLVGFSNTNTGRALFRIEADGPDDNEHTLSLTEMVVLRGLSSPANILIVTPRVEGEFADLEADNDRNVHVGGTLAVPANAAPDEYAGEVTLIAQYK